MTLFDNQGNLQPTPLTESVQIRVYRSIVPTDHSSGETASSFAEAIKSSGQDFYQIRLSRPQLFANQTGGLRATERDEREFFLLNAFGPDEGSPSHSIPLDQYQPVLQSCFLCHRGAGIHSINSRSRLLKPNWFEREFSGDPPGPTHPWWEYDQTVSWKQGRYDWGLLSGYWKSDVSLR